MYELKVITSFAAAHQLKMVTAKCENLHGHNWAVEVNVSGETLNDAGVLIDFGIIKKHLSEIIVKLDHKFLNEISRFHDDNPSSENIARYVAEEMKILLKDTPVTISRVSVWESDDACATYTPG